jgi:putative photosynthetic complex assembly protein 2
VAALLYPTLFALFAWWFSTGLVLYIVGRPRSTHLTSMMVMTALAGAALLMLYMGSDDTGSTGAYVAFSAALVVWGWHEMAFLLGFVTGPRKHRSTKPAHQRAPLRAAIEVVIYHEVAIAMTVIALAVMTAGEPNTVGLWTFVTLWIARLSTKFNIYLGVPNHTEQFLPNHLRYLASYFCKRPINLLFPITVTAATALTGVLLASATKAGASAHDVAAAAFLAALMALVVIEHWFLVLPLPSAELWTWGLASRRDEADASTGATGPTDEITQHSSKAIFCDRDVTIHRVAGKGVTA